MSLIYRDIHYKLGLWAIKSRSTWTLVRCVTADCQGTYHILHMSHAIWHACGSHAVALPQTVRHSAGGRDSPKSGAGQYA